MNRKALMIVLSFLVVTVLTAAVFNKQDNASEFLESRAILTIRSVGHQLLLQAGDSTSRLLPIKEIRKGVFQIEFQNRFSFIPDTLVRIVKTNLALANLPINYQVKVIECSSHEMVYGFEINSIQNSIVACLGRAQPLACYTIQIAFVDYAIAAQSGIQYYFYFLGAIGMAAVFFLGLGYIRMRRTPLPSKNTGVKIGMYSFFVGNRLLRCGDETIELSLKESKVLGILAEQPNELVTRNRLLKEVWENDGVFTGRSLDVFISKLRKKFKNDPAIQLTNTHGLGYTLEIRND